MRRKPKWKWKPGRCDNPVYRLNPPIYPRKSPMYLEQSPAGDTGDGDLR